MKFFLFVASVNIVYSPFLLLKIPLWPTSKLDNFYFSSQAVIKRTIHIKRTTYEEDYILKGLLHMKRTTY